MNFGLAVALLLGTIKNGSAEPLPLEEIGPARLLANIPREDGLVVLRFSDVFELTVEVDGGPALQVEAPTLWTTSAGWKIKNVERPTTTAHGTGRRWRQSFLLDPLTPAPAPVELKPLRYRNDDGRWHIVGGWKPIAVKVVVQSTDGDLKNLREHPTIEELPAPPRLDWEWPAAALTAGLGALALMVYMVRRRAVRSARSRSAEEIALYELKRLDALRLPERGRVAEFHTLLANIVRRYLEKRYDFPARRLTTQEFCAVLEQSPLLGAEQKNFLGKFLKQCDLAKFAEAQVSVQGCAELCQQTLEFLRP